MGKLFLMSGDYISTSENKDAIVNTANQYMISGSSICEIIYKNAGHELEQYCKENYKIVYMLTKFIENNKISSNNIYEILLNFFIKNNIDYLNYNVDFLPFTINIIKVVIKYTKKQPNTCSCFLLHQLYYLINWHIYNNIIL